LLAATLRQAAEKGESEISIYVPKDGAGRAFAEAMGMRYRSSLWRMELAPATPVPAAAFPAGFVARGYGDWLPLPRYVALINEGFTGHPTPVSWTEQAVAYAMSQPGFDPSGIQIVCPANDPDSPVGFVRAVRAGPDESGRLSGEIRMVGVLPEWRRHGLGRELLRWGVARLREQGAGTIQLTVEAENEHALGLYRRTGFEPAVEWPHWAIATDAPIPGPG
jgi:mycothiol synthase